MENDILDALEDLGYSGTLPLDETSFQQAVEETSVTPEYTELVEWLTKDLKSFCELEEHVNAITNIDDSGNFLLELSSFLREYGCPYSSLSEGPVTQRLASRDSKLQLLDFLTSECAAVRMIACSKPDLLKTQKPSSDSAPAQSRESDEALHLKWMLIALGFPKPPENITSFQLFSKIEQKIKELVAKKPELISKSLLKSRLSDNQWHHILEINAVLKQEYETRRETLLKRLDVTIQSFMWSERAKNKENKIAEVYQPIRKIITTKSEVKIPEILAAREDLLYMQKTSSGDAREKAKCAINRVLIGRVPDRGGRAWEHEVPPPEMPAFKQRDSQPQGRPQSGRGGGGYGGDRGGGRGGKVQGGWGGDNKSHSHGGNWEKGGGGYSQQGQNYNQNYDRGYNQGGGQNQGGGYNQGGYSQGGYNQGGYNQSGGGGGGGYNQGYQDQNKGYSNYRGGHDRGGGGRGRGRGGRGRGRGNY